MALVGASINAPFRAAGAEDSAEPSLEQLGEIQVESIYSASKYEQKVTKAATSASVVTSEEIKRFGYRDLGDVLRSVRGFNVTNDRNYSYIGLRGFLRPGDYSSRVLVLINGHRFNDNLYDSGILGGDAMVDVDLIDRVEIVRGPGSAIYGNNAYFGVINIVTKTAAQVDGAEVSGATASFDTYKGRFTYGGSLAKDWRLLLSGTVSQSAGARDLYYKEFDSPETNGGVVPKSDEESVRSLFGSLQYKGLTLEGAYSYRDKQVPTASFGTVFGDTRERTRDERPYVELRYDTAPEAEWGVNARVSYEQYNYSGDYPTRYGDDPAGPITMNLDRDRGEWLGAEVSVRKTFADRYTLIVGAEGRENLQQHLLNFDAEPYELGFESKRTVRNEGVFGQAEAEITDQVSITTGLRYDHYQTIGGRVTPRAAIIYSPLKQTTLKFLYGEAFRAPNVYESFYDAGAVVHRATLQPESIRTYEVVLEQYLWKNWRTSLSLYHFDAVKLIDQVPIPGQAFYLDNVGGAAANGVETEVEMKFGHGWLGRASYALQRTVSEETKSDVSNSPRHLVKALVSAPVYSDQVFLSMEVLFNSSVGTLAGAKTEDYTLLNATLFSQKIARGLEASASIYNILDTRYTIPGAADHMQDVIPQDGRTFRVKVTYHF